MRPILFHSKSIPATKRQPQEERVSESCVRSLPDNQCIHRWNNEQTLITRAECHHHVSGRVLGDANTCPLRTLPLQVEHSFHVILLPIRCLPIQPKREAI